jgi:hypothetical protein
MGSAPLDFGTYGLARQRPVHEDHFPFMTGDALSLVVQALDL